MTIGTHEPRAASPETPHQLYGNMDIIHVIGALAAGGAERFVVDLLIRLKAMRLSVGLLVLSSRYDATGARMKNLLHEAGIPFALGPTARVRFRTVFWYLRQLEAVRPGIVHLHTENTELVHYFATRLRQREYTILRTVHNTDLRLTFLNTLAMNSNKAATSIACSDAVEHRLEGKLHGSLVTIRNGINFDWPIQNNTLKADYRNSLSLSMDNYHFVQVGRQTGESLETSQKGIDILIQAWKMSSVGRNGALLHLLGDGNLSGQLRAMAANDSSIVFHGIRDNVRDWLLAADCFVMPSRHEGLPIAGIEAVGTGVRCLFSNIGPLKELGSPAALWSSPGDAGQLAANLKAVMTQDTAVPAEATEAARRRFGIESTAAQYRQCYLDHLHDS